MAVTRGGESRPNAEQIILQAVEKFGTGTGSVTIGSSQLTGTSPPSRP